MLVIILYTSIIKKLEQHNISTVLIGNYAKILNLEETLTGIYATPNNVAILSVQQTAYIMFTYIKTCYIIKISGIITLI